MLEIADRAADSRFVESPESAAIRALQDVARLFYDRNWALGTSGNYSVVLDRAPLRLLVTASGKDKRGLTDLDFVTVDGEGRTLQAAPGAKPSAETRLHTVLAQDAGVGAVLHTHSVWNTLLSDLLAEQRVLRLSGYEMLKGLSGVTTHETTVEIAIFENTQDIPALAREVRRRIDARDPALRHAFLIRAHGLYTWGVDLAEARRHVEILEFLFEVTARKMAISSAK